MGRNTSRGNNNTHILGRNGGEECQNGSDEVYRGETIKGRRRKLMEEMEEG